MVAGVGALRGAEDTARVGRSGSVRDAAGAVAGRAAFAIDATRATAMGTGLAVPGVLAVFLSLGPVATRRVADWAGDGGASGFKVFVIARAKESKCHSSSPPSK